MRHPKLIFFALIVGVLLVSTAAHADITTGLYGHWPCQDSAASTVVVNIGGSGGNGTLNGGDNTVDLSTTGPNDTYPLALNLNGSDDWVSVVTTSTQNKIVTSGSGCTVAFWIKRDDTGNDVVIQLSTTEAPDGGAYIYLPDATTCAVRFGATQKDFAISALSTTWHHIAVTLDTSKNILLYVDGAVNPTPENDATINNVWFIGFGAFSGPNLFFNGAIADVRTYTRTLSAGDVTELYQGASAVPTGAIYYYLNGTNLRSPLRRLLNESAKIPVIQSVK